MRETLLFLIVLFFFFSNAKAQNDLKIRIDPENGRGGMGVELFDSVEFIPLETTKDSRFGSISQLGITDSFFVVYDRMAYVILIFRKDGSFVKKISKNGQDRYLSYFSIIPDSNRIAAISYTEEKLFIYDFNGKLVRSQGIPVNGFEPYHFSSNNSLYHLRRFNNDGTFATNRYDLAYADSTGKVTKYLHPFPEGLNMPEFSYIENPVNFSGEPGSCIFSLPFEYKVYQLNDTGILTKYSFVFPAKVSLPDNFAYDPSFNGRRTNYVYYTPENKEKIRGINSFYKVGSYLLFSAENGNMRVSAERNFLYSLSTSNLYSFKRLTPDSRTGYLSFLNTSLDNVHGVYKDYIYASIPSGRVLNQIDNQDKLLHYPESLNKLIHSGSKMDNPVIVQFKLKKNL